MTYRDFITKRAKRLQLGAYSDEELMSLINDAISKIEMQLFKHYGEIFYLTGLPSGRSVLNLSTELSMVIDVYKIVESSMVPYPVYYDYVEFFQDFPSLHETVEPTACLVLPSNAFQLAQQAHTRIYPNEQFSLTTVGGNSRLVLLFNSVTPVPLEFRVVGKRGFSRIYRENDTNLLLTDWSDLLLSSLRCIISEDRSNWQDLKNHIALFQEKLFSLNRIAAQKDAELIGGLDELG